MTIKLFAGSTLLGTVESKIIDGSMGVVGGLLLPSPVYFSNYQAFFRLHTRKPNWNELADLQLSAYSPSNGKLHCEGGICITDIEGCDEIDIDLAGLNQEVMDSLRAQPL